ncbi:WecB/TagA/CpsF family glycosyltransferase [Acaryochloris sp. IP29b_bin.137]|uniref:WecB/TagA/CpsF family glycosyltransferase n=1 Tax=Acaryochloris sp. IP29b_bin.137 TaxID=2969217 RepID=UPI00261ECCE7|nr:WecB/TagA/CpsF family glycosyltransferase [Acaryochloris sp. IP29b_bin.137]
MRSTTSVLERNNFNKTVNEPTRLDIIGSKVTAAPFNTLVGVIFEWTKRRDSKTVCVANTHMLVEAHQRPSFSEVILQADMVTPDGMPLVWMLRLMGAKNQDRVAGLDLLRALCKKASQENISVYFLGSMDLILQRMKHRLQDEFPHLIIADMEPLPFRSLTPAEDESLIQRVNESGAGLVMVALGCPKQECWMAAHKGKIEAVMVGLGGAFPVYAGIHRRANKWLRSLGLEWLFRLHQEPKRLWKRYATSIPLFIYLAIKQLCHRSLGMTRVSQCVLNQ